MSKFIISRIGGNLDVFPPRNFLATTGNERKNKHFSDLKRLRVPKIDSLLQNTIRDTRELKTFHSTLYFLPLTPVFSTAYF